MITIKSFTELMTLENKLSEPIFSELKGYYKEIMTAFLGDENCIDTSFEDIGIIAILEDADDIHHLPEINMTEETIPLLESLPEFVDEIELEDGIWHRCTIILSASDGIVLYIPESKNKDELKDWIQKWKGSEIK